MLRNNHDCLFQNGTVDCKKEDCPPVKCDHPTFREGQCCPQCFSKYFKYIVPINVKTAWSTEIVTLN